MDIVTVKIERLGTGGLFIGRVISEADPRNGMKAFVDGAAPGEIVTALVEKQEKRLLFCKLLEVLQKSSARITAPCRVFEECGGCDLQHIDIENQREYKRELIREMLLKHSKLQSVPGVIVVGENLPSYGYRRRASFHVNESGEIGFYKKGTGRIIDIDQCLVCREVINEALQVLRERSLELGKSVAKIIIEEIDSTPHVVLIQRENSPRLDLQIARELGRRIRSLEVRGLNGASFFKNTEETLAIGHFSQINSAANELLIQAVLDEIPVGGVTELYAGGGNFTIPIAKKGCKVTAIEIDGKLVSISRLRAEKEGVAEQIRYVESSVERYIKSDDSNKVILLDPPREGAKAFAEKINPAKAGHVVYVSCSLPTLCRDLRLLAEKGYTLLSLKMFDMFPQTHYVETLSVLKLDM